jgi:adenosine deaminase
MTAASTDNALALALTMPKAELHVHIEGTLEPALAFALARRNGVSLPYADEAALAAAYDFDSLQSFLDLYYACADVLRTRQDFCDLMLAYLERAAADHVVHAEIFFDPQTHTARGIPMGVVIHGLLDGIAQGADRLGISARLILCFLRHLPEEDCLATLAEAEPYLEHIAGFGLDSSERGNPPSRFQRLFARCRALGKPVVAHAGEEGPAAYITEALDLLGSARIDHGVRAVDDPAVVARLVRDRIPLTVCPLSNIRLCVFGEMGQHTLAGLLEAGACVTLNSDDPAYFGGYLNDNIRAVQAAFGFDAATWHTLARNSFEASFVDDDQRSAWLARLDAHFAPDAANGAA